MNADAKERLAMTDLPGRRCEERRGKRRRRRASQDEAIPLNRKERLLAAYVPTQKPLAMTGLANLIMKQFYVYIMTNAGNTVLYTCVTNDLLRRVYEHKEKLIEGFTKKYNATRLVYYEACETAYAAISREKQIKGGSRQKKIDLINSINPDWHDLYDEL